MKFLRSIRWRLQIWHGLLLVAVLGGFGAAMYRVESERQLRRVDDELQRRLRVLGSSRHPVPNAHPPRQSFSLQPQNAALFDQGGDGRFYYIVWLHSGNAPIRSSAAPPDVAMPTEGGSTGTRAHDGFRETYLLPAPGDCLLVGHPMAQDLAEMHHLAWGLAVVGGAVLLAGLAVGAFLVQRSLKPIGDISVAAQKIATGDLTQRIAGSASDSELGQLVNVLNSTFARLDAAFSQQAHFTADAAHELRTPVSVILAQAQDGLSGACENSEHREAFEAIERATRRMRGLIDSLLELARLDAGQEAPHRAACDLAAITAEGIELIRPIASQRGVHIDAELAPARFSGDAGRVAQVITNLLTNAVEYNRAGGEVQIKTGRENGSATFVVHNTGPGIAAEDLSRIFERFYRADKARTGGAGHTGLGLAIAKAIVQVHGGSIRASSQPGKGATFVVALPSH